MKVWYQNHNHVLTDLVKEFDIVDKIEEADRVLLWNDVIYDTQAIVRYAHQLKKPVIVFQHGRKGSSRYFPPFNEKIIADKMCVWGQLDKDRLVKAGNDPDRIEVTSTTLFNYLKPRKKHDKINIVFSPDHWDDEIPENLNTAKELLKLKDVKIITKLIEGQDPKLYPNPVCSNRTERDHMYKCAAVLAKADLVVGISEGTFELFAQALDIPVVIMTDWEPKSFGGDPRYNTYWRYVSEASKKASLKDLNKVIKQQLKNPDELKAERRRLCIEEGGINIQNPLEKMVKTVWETKLWSS